MANFLVRNTNTDALTLVTGNLPIDLNAQGLVPGSYEVFRHSETSETFAIAGDNASIADLLSVMPVGTRLWVPGFDTFSDAGVTAATTGDFVQQIDDQGATGDTLQNNGVDPARPILQIDVSSNPYLEMDADSVMVSNVNLPAPATLTLALAYAHTSGKFVISQIRLGQSGDEWIGLAESGDTSTSFTQNPLSVFEVDGVAFAGTTRGDVYNHITGGDSLILSLDANNGEAIDQVRIEKFSTFLPIPSIYAVLVSDVELSAFQKQQWNAFATAAKDGGIVA